MARGGDLGREEAGDETLVSRLDVATATRDPRAARGSRSTSSLRRTRSTTRPMPTPSRSSAPTPRARPAPCTSRGQSRSASIRPFTSTAACTASPRPGRRGRDAGELEGRTHLVVSGLCLLGTGFAVVEHAVTRVTFRALSGAEIDAYVESGEWRGRAGGYAIQGIGGSTRRAASTVTISTSSDSPPRSWSICLPLDAPKSCKSASRPG